MNELKREIVNKPVHILYSPNGQNKSNTEPFIVLYDPRQWPDRILKKRGYDRMQVIFKRETCESEAEWLSKQWRCAAYKYKNIDELISDEINTIGEDHPEIQVLQELKEKIYNLKSKI